MTKRVLVVEDMIDMALLLREAMRRSGYAVDLAYNERDAMLRLDGRAYDLVITDIALSQREAQTLYGHIRKTQPAASIIAIADSTAAACEHADSMLEKPIDFTRLVRTVRQLLHRPENTNTFLAQKAG